MRPGDILRLTSEGYLNPHSSGSINLRRSTFRHRSRVPNQ